jgi:tRNA (guanine9-N1)-methyltransferase
MDPDRSPAPLSKSAQKKAIKAERYAALKLERRAREKEAKKQKKRLLAEKRALAPDDSDDRPVHKKQRVEWGARIIVDLGFDDKMTDKVRPISGISPAFFV